VKFFLRAPGKLLLPAGGEIQVWNNSVFLLAGYDQIHLESVFRNLGKSKIAKYMTVIEKICF
jgi:hypothetical protein